LLIIDFLIENASSQPVAALRLSAQSTIDNLQSTTIQRSKLANQQSTGTGERDDKWRHNEHDQRVFDERHAGTSGAVGERNRERDDVVRRKRQRRAPEGASDSGS
jgi:hypothetical protein